MTKRPLFDVTIAVSGNDDTGTGIYDVTIVDRYHKRGDIIGEKRDLTSLDDAIVFAKGAVTAFMQGTPADPAE
ncbi:hypothetical protein [Mycolicibacterium mageritense]|uniref:hypothetical protein n=1 Tax=Mycolicibacterium mageritense TaxID=53462 RepID=UPI001E33EF78|nr:hypothetical protein [Mycolicibacterium mageritense]GJJ20066.1 hypothetical protein MTY414_37390 [Mycolicibacterium mageritense]